MPVRYDKKIIVCQSNPEVLTIVIELTLETKDWGEKKIVGSTVKVFEVATAIWLATRKEAATYKDTNTKNGNIQTKLWLIFFNTKNTQGPKKNCNSQPRRQKSAASIRPRYTAPGPASFNATFPLSIYNRGCDPLAEANNCVKVDVASSFESLIEA